ncbi:unnamed protein product, partial [Effrenium voratum]
MLITDRTAAFRMPATDDEAQLTYKPGSSAELHPIFVTTPNPRLFHHEGLQNEKSVLERFLDRMFEMARRYKVPIFFHNGGVYDFHFLLKEISRLINRNSSDDPSEQPVEEMEEVEPDAGPAEDEVVDSYTEEEALEEQLQQKLAIIGDYSRMKFSVLVKSGEKCLSFQLGPLQFLDSTNFVKESLDKTIETRKKRRAGSLPEAFPLVAAYHPELRDVSEERKEQVWEALMRKLPMPFSRFNGPSAWSREAVWEREAYDSFLKNEKCSEESYNQLLETRDMMRWTSFRQFHDCYLHMDCLALLDVLREDGGAARRPGPLRKLLASEKLPKNAKLAPYLGKHVREAVDLERLQYMRNVMGARIWAVHRVISFECTELLEPFMRKIYAQRKELKRLGQADGEQTLKLVMNSIYGKAVQDCSRFKNTNVYTNAISFEKAQARSSMVDYDFFPSDGDFIGYVHTIGRKAKLLKSPLQAFFSSLKPAFPLRRPLGTDTDSLVVQVWCCRGVDPRKVLAEANISLPDAEFDLGDCKEGQEDLRSFTEAELISLRKKMGAPCDESFPGKLMEWVGLCAKQYSKKVLRGEKVEEEHR